MKRLVLVLLCLAINAFAASSQEYIVTKFGVGNDSTKLSTKAIQKAIDKAALAGGGVIVIPKGTYLTGALFFKPKTKLRLAEGARLKGSDNISDYPLIPSRMEGRSLNYYAALINAYKVDNFSITGPGTIDGNGLRYWKKFWAYRDSLKQLNQVATNLDVHRPRLVFIWASNNVHIKNVKLRNSGFWTTHLYQCNNALIEGCDIRSPHNPVPAPSTDGIDIDVCKKVTVRNCFISVNDDAIAIKGGKGPDAHKLPVNGPVEDILIEDCTFGEAHSTLTIGSESIIARNITMRNCHVENNCPVLKLKMRPDTYQAFENISIENISGRCGSLINVNPWKQFFDMNGSSERPFGTIRNIRVSNINVKCSKLGDMEGNPSDVISNVVFKDIKASAEKAIFANKYPGVKMENVLVNGEPYILN